MGLSADAGRPPAVSWHAVRAPGLLHPHFTHAARSLARARLGAIVAGYRWPGQPLRSSTTRSAQIPCCEAAGLQCPWWFGRLLDGW